MFAGAIMFIAGMLLTGIMTHIWMFWLFFGVILAAAMAVFQVTLVSGVTIWFKTKLGLAMGTLQGLQGIGTALMILIVFVLFTAWGLRGAFWGPGIVGGAILLLGIRYFHNEPAAIGLRPYGASESEPIRRLQDNPEAKVRASVFLKKAQGTTSFWNLIGIHFWGCAGHNVILIFLVAIAEDDSIGLSRAMSVAIYVTLMVVSTITRFAVPVAADRMGSKGVMGASFVLQTFPLLLLLFAVQVYPEAWLFFVFAILFGIGMGGEMTAFPIINRQYYGDAPIGATYGFQMMGAGIGMALGPLAGGILWDMTDAIWPMLILSFALSLVGVVSIFALPTTSQQVIPDWVESLPEGAQASTRP
jgi:MFS family permease